MPPSIADLDRLVTIPLLRRMDGVAIRRRIDDEGFGITVTNRDSPDCQLGFGGPLDKLGDPSFVKLHLDWAMDIHGEWRGVIA